MCKAFVIKIKISLDILTKFVKMLTYNCYKKFIPKFILNKLPFLFEKIAKKKLNISNPYKYLSLYRYSFLNYNKKQKRFCKKLFSFLY